jgi:DNA-binding PucR family transcriptional regulator
MGAGPLLGPTKLGCVWVGALVRSRQHWGYALLRNSNRVDSPGVEVEWLPALDPAANRVWHEVLCPIATEMRGSAVELADGAVTRVQAEMPALLPDAQAVEENLVSTEAHLTQFAQSVERGTDPGRFDMPSSTLSVVRSGVRRQIPLADLMRFYRLAQEQVWQWMFVRITAATTDPAEQATALELATRWLFAYADGAMIRVDHAYELEREGWMRSADATRAAAIEEILAGRERDVQRASAQLRYDANQHHVGVIVWLDRVSDDAQPMLSDALASLAHILGAENTLSHHLGSLALAGWVSRRRAFSADELDVIKQFDQSVVLPSGLRAAAGEPGHGLPGFRRSHVEAQHARRVASLSGRRARTCTRYRTVAVAALATADHEHALSFVNRVLGPLGAQDETTYRLAVTLAVYLEENRGRRRAAERLMVHPNTVSYRVHQAEEILGRSVSTDTLDIQVALAILATLPGLAHAPTTEV